MRLLGSFKLRRSIDGVAHRALTHTRPAIWRNAGAEERQGFFDSGLEAPSAWFALLAEAVMTIQQPIGSAVHRHGCEGLFSAGVIYTPLNTARILVTN